MSGLVPVREFFDRVSADFVVSTLKSEGIFAVVLGDDMGGTRPDMSVIGRIRVLVKEDDKGRALTLLDDFEAVRPEGYNDGFLEDDESDLANSKLEASVRYAYNAAIFGTFVLPGLAHLYSILILIHASSSWSRLQKKKIAATFCGRSDF